MGTTPTADLGRRLGDWLDHQRAAHQTDSELIGRFVSDRCEAAFAQLVRRHGPGVLAAARRVAGNPHDAEDVFQATFLVLARKAAAVRQREAVAGWLFAVAARLAARVRADGRKREANGDVDGVTAPPAATPGFDVRAVVDEELARLPARYRAVIVLCYLHGKTRAEAAVELGRSPGAVKIWLERGRELLRGRLARRGVTAPGGAMLFGLLAERATAAVPAALAESTTKAAVSFAAGGTAAGAASATVLTLATGGIKAMFWAKLKVWAGCAAAVGLTAGGGGVAWQQAYAQGTAGTGPAVVKVVKPGGGEKPAAAVTAAKKSAEPDRVGTITIVGNETVPDRLILREIGFRPGELLEYPKIETARAKLAGLGAFEVDNPPQVFVVPNPQSKPFVDVQVQVTESPRAKFVAAAIEAADGTDVGADPDDVADIKKQLDALIRQLEARKKAVDKPAAAKPAPTPQPKPALATEIPRFEFKAAPLAANKAVAFSPDGKTIAAQEGSVVRVYDAATGKLLWESIAPSGLTFSFSPDGKTLSGALRLDAATGKPAPAAAPVREVVVRDANVRVWDVAGGALDPVAVQALEKLAKSADPETAKLASELLKRLTAGKPAPLVLSRPVVAKPPAPPTPAVTAPTKPTPPIPPAATDSRLEAAKLRDLVEAQRLQADLIRKQAEDALNQAAKAAESARVAEQKARAGAEKALAEAEAARAALRDAEKKAASRDNPNLQGLQKRASEAAVEAQKAQVEAEKLRLNPFRRTDAAPKTDLDALKAELDALKKKIEALEKAAPRK